MQYTFALVLLRNFPVRHFPVLRIPVTRRRDARASAATTLAHTVTAQSSSAWVTPTASVFFSPKSNSSRSREIPQTVVQYRVEIDVRPTQTYVQWKCVDSVYTAPAILWQQTYSTSARQLRWLKCSIRFHFIRQHCNSTALTQHSFYTENNYALQKYNNILLNALQWRNDLYCRQSCAFFL